jgi:hypothetical protein
VADSCEHGNENFGSIKGREFLVSLSILLVSQEDFCSMELYICFFRPYVFSTLLFVLSH